MSARLTLDRNAMEALLDSMAPEAKVEFTNKVLKVVLQRIVEHDIHEYMQRNNSELLKQISAEYFSDAWKHVGLREVHEAKLRKAVQGVLKDESDKAMRTFSERMHEAQARVTAAVQTALSASGVMLKAQEYLKKSAAEECRQVMRRLTTRVSFLADETE